MTLLVGILTLSMLAMCRVVLDLHRAVADLRGSVGDLKAYVCAIRQADQQVAQEKARAQQASEGARMRSARR